MGVAHGETLRLLDGRPVVDLLDASGGMTLGSPAPMMGGEEGTCLYVPPKPGQTIVGHSGGSGSTMVPLSTWPPSNRQGFVEETPDIDDDDDYPKDQHTVRDILLQHKGNKILLDEVGRLVITTKRDILRFQLPEGGAIRVSQEGEDTSGRLALAGPVADSLQAIVQCLEDLVSRVSAIELAISLAIPAPNEAGFATAKAALALGPIPGGAVAPDRPKEEDISAAAFLVSSQPVSDL